MNDNENPWAIHPFDPCHVVLAGRGAMTEQVSVLTAVNPETAALVVRTVGEHDDLRAALTNLVAAIDGSHAQVAFAVGVAKRVLARVSD